MKHLVEALYNRALNALKNRQICLGKGEKVWKRRMKPKFAVVRTLVRVFHYGDFIEQTFTAAVRVDRGDDVGREGGGG